MAALLVMAVMATAARGQTAIEPPLVVDGAAEDGQVVIEPAAQTVVDGRVVWLVRNGGEDALSFDLAVHEVVATDDGVDVGAPHADLALAVDRLRLGAGEVARVPLHVDEGVRGAFALVAQTVDAEPATTVSGVALRAADVEVRPSVTAADASDGTLTVRLDAEGPSLVDVALRSSAWPGVARSETVVEGVLVPPGGRDLEVALGGVLAGRVRLEVAVAPVAGGTDGAGTDGAGTERVAARAAATVWWWPPLVVVGLVVVLLVLVGAGVAMRWRLRSGARQP